jgi:hypothetical protein
LNSDFSFKKTSFSSLFKELTSVFRNFIKLSSNSTLFLSISDLNSEKAPLTSDNIDDSLSFLYDLSINSLNISSDFFFKTEYSRSSFLFFSNISFLNLFTSSIFFSTSGVLYSLDNSFSYERTLFNVSSVFIFSFSTLSILLFIFS